VGPTDPGVSSLWALVVSNHLRLVRVFSYVQPLLLVVCGGPEECVSLCRVGTVPLSVPDLMPKGIPKSGGMEGSV
jgi:hypothetical protein